MKKLESIIGTVVGKIGNAFILLIIRLFMKKQHDEFHAAVLDFQAKADKTPNFK